MGLISSRTFSSSNRYGVDVLELSNKSAYSLYDLRRASAIAEDAILSCNDPFTLVTNLVKNKAGVFSSPIRPAVKGSDKRIRHLCQVCRTINSRDDVIEAEGIRFGKMFGSADVVLFDGFTLTLIDFTADMSLRSSKIKSLTKCIKGLQRILPGYAFMADVWQVTCEVDIKDVFPSMKDEEEERYSFQADLAECMKDASLSPEPFISALSNSIDREESHTIAQEHDDLVSFKKVLTGGCLPVDVQKVLRLSRAKYPRMCNVASKLGLRARDLYKGMAPPSETASAIGSKGETWASLLSLFMHIEEAEMVAWSEGNMPKKVKVPHTMQVTLKKMPGGGAKIFLTDDAPKEWHDLVHRDNKRSKREALDPMSSEETSMFFSNAEEELSVFTTSLKTSVYGTHEVAEKLLENSKHHDLAHAKAAGLAHSFLKGCSSTLGYQVLATARSIAASSALASTASGKGDFKVCSYSGGRILTLTKKTGDLSNNNDTSCIAAVSSPMGPRGSWEKQRVGGIGLSKCILLKTSLRNHLDRSVGSSLMTGSAYADGSWDQMTGFDACSMHSVCSISNNKGFGVCLSVERALSEGSNAIFNDVDAIAKKLEDFSPGTKAEAVILLRVVLRSLACCLIRDTGTLAQILELHKDGTRTPVYVPAFARSGHFTFSGLINSVYDYSAGSPESASRIRNEAKAFMGVFEEVEDYERRAEFRDQTLWCASNKTVQAWKKGYLHSFVYTKDFVDCEVEFIKSLAVKDVKHAGSAALLFSYATKYCKDNDMEKKCELVANQISMTSMEAYISNKRAADIDAMTEEKAALGAYATVSKYLLGLLFLGPILFKSTSIVNCLFSQEAYAPSELITYVILAMQDPRSFYVICKAKDFTVEKTRDFFMMSANMRVIQAFTENMSRLIGGYVKWSALQEGSKVSVMNRTLEKTPPRSKVPMVAMTDKSRYGPSRVPGLLYGVMACLGLSPKVSKIYRYSLSKIRKKEVRPPDSLIDVEEEVLRDLERSIAPGIIDIMNRVKESKTKSLLVETGMGQGLCQATADACTGIASGVLEDVLVKKFGTAAVHSTNDDGVAIIYTGAEDAYENAALLAKTLLVVGVVTSEYTNRSKVVISTWGANLNTQFRHIGDRVGKDRGSLPWVRSLCSITGERAITDIKSSSYEALTCTNSAVDEGAPLFALLLAQSLSFATHYERFRFTDSAMKQEFLGHLPSRLGAPIFFPHGVKVFGPKAIEAAYLAKRAGYSIEEASSIMVADMAVNDLTCIGSLKWASEEGMSDTTSVFTEYTFTTVPFSRIKGDTELTKILERVETSLARYNVRKGSLAESLIRRFLELVHFSRDDNVRSVCTSVYKAATAYSEKKDRIIAKDTAFLQGNRTVSTRKINLVKMREELCHEYPRMTEASVGDWGVTLALTDLAKDAFICIRPSLTPGRLTQRAQRYEVKRLSFDVLTCTKEDEVAFAVQILPDTARPEMSYYAAMKGVYTIPLERSSPILTVAEILKAEIGARRLASAAFPKEGSPILINTCTKVTSRTSYASSAPCSDLGMGVRLAGVPEKTSILKSSIVTQPKIAVMSDRMGAMVGRSYDSLIRRDGIRKRPRFSLQYETKTFGQMSFTSLLRDPGSLIPDSTDSAGMMTTRCVVEDANFYAGNDYIEKIRKKGISRDMRYLAPNFSAMSGGGLKINGRNASAYGVVTRVRSHVKTGYHRRINLLVPYDMKITSVEMMAKGKFRSLKMDVTDKWIFVEKGFNNDYSLKIDRGNDPLTPRAECFPCCITLSNMNYLDTHIIMEMPEWVRVKVMRSCLSDISPTNAVEREHRVEAAIGRLSAFLESIPNLGIAISSALAGETPEQVMMSILNFIIALEDDIINKRVLHDIRMIIWHFKKKDQMKSVSAWIFSLFTASGFVSLDYGIHSGEDGPAIWSVMKLHFYVDKMIVDKKKKALVKKDPRLKSAFEHFDELDNQSLASDQSIKVEELEDDLGEDDAAKLGIGPVSEEEVEVTEEMEGQFLSLLTPNANKEVKAVRIKYFVKTSKSKQINDALVMPYLEMLSKASMDASLRLSSYLMCSACLLTSLDILEADTLEDEKLLRFLNCESVYNFSMMNSSKYQRFVATARFNISTFKKRNPDLYIPTGIYDSRPVGLQSKEAKERMVIVMKQTVKGRGKLKGYTKYSKMSYIGSLGCIDI